MIVLLIGDCQPVQATEDIGKMQAAVLAERVTQLWRLRAHVPAFHALAVEDAERVHGPLVAVLVAQLVGVRFQKARQLFSIPRSTRLVTEGIDSQAQRRQAEVRVQPGQ